MKICVLILFLMLPWISRVGDWALGWTEGNERLQIIFVMMLFPLIMNALQYYIIDSFIKKQESKDDGSTDRDDVAYDQLPDEMEEDAAEEELEVDTTKHRGPGPDLSGGGHPAVGGSSGRGFEDSRVLPKELLPQE